jgi:hypothetical protein
MEQRDLSACLTASELAQAGGDAQAGLSACGAQAGQ